jgi:hypothetical protein
MFLAHTHMYVQTLIVRCRKIIGGSRSKVLNKDVGYTERGVPAACTYPTKLGLRREWWEWIGGRMGVDRHGACKTWEVATTGDTGSGVL